MLQIGNKPIDTMYVGGKLVQQAYMGSKKVYPLHGVIPKAIKDSMVLWYDIKRQGATNENMAATPTLRDLSGNGHDATCYNFSWSGMSGIGGYLTDFTASLGSGEGITKTVDKIVMDNYTAPTSLYAFQANNGNWIVPSGTRIRFSGISGKCRLCLIASINGTSGWYNLLTGTNNELPYITEDGEYSVLEYDYENVGSTQLKIYNLDSSNTTFDGITIEQLPLYPNALVSDGVDDYAQVTGLPILTKERGYTVIAKRKWLQDIARNCLVSKNTHWLTVGQGGIDGAFVVECNTAQTYSFGNSANINTLFNNNDEFVYQTSVSYNGKATINPGNNEDNNHLCIAAIKDGTTWYSSLAIYSLLLFNRDLNTEEIEWVKTNLIETEQ